MVTAASGCFVIAEAGVNHNGDEALARQLIDAAVRAGANAVKFQTFHADLLAAPSAQKAAYQQEMTGAGDQHSMLRALELPDAAYGRLAQYCAQCGIEFMSTPFDETAADMLVALGMRRIKIPSGEVTNFPFLEHLANLRRPLILSTGMSTLDEVTAATACIDTVWKRVGRPEVEAPLTALHCTSNYPAAPADVNLRAMLTMHAALRLPVGYSDHTVGIGVALAAVALGAAVIEKHFTLDRILPGPDHRASLEPGELADLVREIRVVESALGSPIKQPTASELPVRDVVRRSVCLRRPVIAGQLLELDDLILLRPGTGIAPVDLPRVQGRRAARDMDAGTALRWDDLAQ